VSSNRIACLKGTIVSFFKYITACRLCTKNKSFSTRAQKPLFNHYNSLLRSRVVLKNTTMGYACIFLKNKQKTGIELSL
jgi:hypothetical protein